MATTGNEESAITPKDHSHVYANPPTGSAVAAPQTLNGTPIPEYDPSKPHSYSPPHTSATSDEHHRIHKESESGHPKSQHGWPQRLQNVGMHSATTLNDFAAKMGSESFMPVTMDKECEKAARILSGFCSKYNPFYDDAPGKNIW